MRLLIADKLHPRAIEELRALPLEVIYEPELTKETLEANIDKVGILVVRSTEVTREALARAKQLCLVVRAGAEHHTIDVKAASERGIFVAHCPGKNATAVVELVFGMMVALDRRIPDAVGSLRAKKWERTEYSKAEGLLGKTIGIVGLGAIGREVAARAKAFGLHPIAWNRNLTPAKAAELGVGYAASIEELARKSDIFTVHLRLTERTRGLINERVLSALPPRAIFLNLARAGLVDYDALKRAVRERGLRAAVDVYPDEPKGQKHYDTDLFEGTASASGGFLYGTPHIAASTDQAQAAISTEAVRVIRSFLLDGTVPNSVNVSSGSLARFLLIMRAEDKVGTLANVLAVIKRHAINVEEITNSVFEGATASSVQFKLLSRPSEACLQEIKAFDEVLHLEVVTLPSLA